MNLIFGTSAYNQINKHLLSQASALRIISIKATASVNRLP
jgi:hypothetical protein